MHVDVIITDKNMYSLYNTVNCVRNTAEVNISLSKSIVLKIGFLTCHHGT